MKRLFMLAMAAIIVVAYLQSAGRDDGAGIASKLPPIRYPADNTSTAGKIELGRHLFYDRRLSFNNSLACADCHVQSKAFSDPKASSVGSTGEATPRNAMSLTNVAYNARFTWANDQLLSLEQQMLIPLTGSHPIEMGFDISSSEIIARLSDEPYYQRAFPAEFPGQNAISLDNIVKAIATFQRTLLSFNSVYDQHYRDGPARLSDSAERGLQLFFSPDLKCIQCHSGFNFRFMANFRSGPDDNSVAMHNTGLYNIDGRGAYPASDRGLLDVTRRDGDMGHFKTPTLRNVGVSAPYMHDGSIATLDEVIDHYARGGRIIPTGPNRGDGSQSPLKSPLVSGFSITEKEKGHLIAFLHSLTDEEFLHNPALSNPWEDAVIATAPP